MRRIFFILIVLAGMALLRAQSLEPFDLEGKSITALAVSPANPSATWNWHLFAGTSDAGVFARNLSSPDSDWIYLGFAGNKITSLHVQHWGVGPADFNTLFAGIEPGVTSWDTTVIYQYTQQGTWIPSDSGIDHNQVHSISAMAGFSYSGHEPPQPLFAAGGWSIYRSTAFGQNWENVWQEQGSVNALKADQSNGEVWAGGSRGRDDQFPWIAKSKDQGATWERIAINASGMNSVLSIAIHPDHADTVYLGLRGLVLKTTDGGATWNNTGLKNAQVHFTSLALDSGNPEHIWAGGPIDEAYLALWKSPFAMWESYNGGTTWQAVIPIWRVQPVSIKSLVADPLEAGVVYIASGSGVWRYTSRVKPPGTIKVPEEYASIQAAIDASISGDTVLVAPGRYTENIDFHGKGILLVSSEGPDMTIIDGNQNGSVVTFASGEDSTACIKGFTIRNGSGTAAANGQYGGGIYCLSSSPGIKHNIIRDNNVLSGCGAFGGGIAILGNSRPIIEGNHLTANSVTSLCDALVNYGGAAYVGGSSAPLLRENVLIDNYADYGGGIAVQDSVKPVIQKNRISENRPNGIMIGAQALPLIGGLPGFGNDIDQKQVIGFGNALLRLGDGQTINAQYNYFGACPPGENEVYPLEEFDTRNCSDWPLRTYFPMDIGNRWTFGTATPISATYHDPFSETIIDTTTLAGRHFYRFDQFRGLDHPLLRLTEDDKLTWRLDIMSSIENVWVDFAAEVGERWEVRTGLESWTVELQSKTDTVYVPAGTFTNCYRFHFFFHGADDDWDEWYAPGIGPVKRILYGIGIIEYPLVSADVHGTQVSAEKNSPNGMPGNYALYQNYPNPFNPSTTISYELPLSSHVTLEIYNLMGQKVRTLMAQKQQAGSYQIPWDGKDETGTALPSGVYFYQLQSASSLLTGKAVLMR
jgi:hypothetical protein